MRLNYDYIIVDGNGTLYEDNYHPIKGSENFLEKYKSKTVLFSNIGSKTGEEVIYEMTRYFRVIPSIAYTSLDLLLAYLNDQQFNSVFHFGNNIVEKKISKLVDRIVSNISDTVTPQALIFTSLPSDKWIKITQVALNYMLTTNAEIILANPDRISPIQPYKITVGILLDGLMQAASKIREVRRVVELGKPSLNKVFFRIEDNSRIVVVGDNPWTDILLGAQLDCDTILVSPNGPIKGAPVPTYTVKSIEELS